MKTTPATITRGKIIRPIRIIDKSVPTICPITQKSNRFNYWLAWNFANVLFFASVTNGIKNKIGIM
jgi:hypothetical protein